jgi:flagellin
MASYVNTNVSSLNAQRRLTNVTNSLNTTYQRLSSGLRINSAKDDAAGLAISDRLTAHINGFNQGNRNASDGIALAQTAEGAMEEMTTMLQRMRTLAVESANGTMTSADRTALAQEFNALKDEIQRIACATTYAGAQILKGASGTGGLVGTGGAVDIHVGSMSTGTGTNGGGSSMKITLTIDDMSSIHSSCGTVDSQSNAEGAIASIDTQLAAVDTARSKLGAAQNRLESTIRNQSSISENLSDARSRIRDTDYAEEASNLSQQSIVQQAATSMLTQANARPQIALSLLG